MTDYIINHRQTGRTTQLLDILCEAPEDEHYVLVVPTMNEALAMIRAVHDRGRSDLAGRIHTLNGWQTRYRPGYARRNVKVLIDNADSILASAVEAPIVAAVFERREEVGK